MTDDIRKRAEEALARAEKATEGPWAAAVRTGKDDWDYWKVSCPGDTIGTMSLSFLEPRTDEMDAVFIAAARVDVPYLAREVLRLLDYIDVIEDAIARNPDDFLMRADMMQRLLDVRRCLGFGKDEP